MGELGNLLGPFPEPGTKIVVVSLTPAGQLNVRASWPATGPDEVVGFLRAAAEDVARQAGGATPSGLIVPGGAL